MSRAIKFAIVSYSSHRKHTSRALHNKVRLIPPKHEMPLKQKLVFKMKVTCLKQPERGFIVI